METEINMNTQKINDVKNIFIAKPVNEILSSMTEDETLVLLEIILGKILCISNFTIKVRDGLLLYHVFSESGEDLLTLNRNYIVNGLLAEDFLKSIRIISVIENELNTALLYPPGMRAQAVKSTCDRIGATEAEFQRVLYNW